MMLSLHDFSLVWEREGEKERLVIVLLIDWCEYSVGFLFLLVNFRKNIQKKGIIFLLLCSWELLIFSTCQQLLSEYILREKIRSLTSIASIIRSVFKFVREFDIKVASFGYNNGLGLIGKRILQASANTRQKFMFSFVVLLAMIDGKFYLLWLWRGAILETSLDGTL